jgi:uncharacterized membrane protein YesL
VNGSREPSFAQPPTGETYVRMTAVSLWENSPLLLLGGLVFVVLCLPTIALLMLGLPIPATFVAALTVAPAWAALLALEAQMARDVQPHIGVMFRALPKFWLRSVGLGLLILFPVLAGLLTLSMASELPAPFVITAGLAADAVGLVFLTVLYLYAFPLLVLYDAPMGTALSNALILASHHLGNTLGLLGMGVLFGIGVVRLNLGLLLVLPTVWGMFVVNNCRMVMAEEADSSTEESAGDSE